MIKEMLRGLALAFVFVGLLTVTGRATTVAEMSDDDLAVSARAIVEGRVLSQSSRFDPSHGAVFTYVELEVERVHKGAITTQRVVLKQLGGEDSGLLTMVHGAPRFSDGERVLLFLTTDADGALRVAHLCLGHFLLLGDGEQERVVRATSDARMLEKAGATHSAPKREFLARVHQALEERWAESMHLVAERYPEPIQAFPAELSQTVSSKGGSSGFTFLGQGFRWFQPDSDEMLFFRINTDGAPTPSGGVAEAEAAFAAWSNVSGSTLRISHLGRSDKCGLRRDGDNVISFGDCDRVLDDPVNCSGVVAIGGVTSAGGGAITIGGRQFIKSVEGDVVFNNGFDCFLSDSNNLGEVMAHELGHVLGLGHSSENLGETNTTLRDATMYFVTHKDGRGASIRADDAEGIRFLYGEGRASSGVVVKTTSLPDALPSKPYTVRLKASGKRPLTWSVTAGSLPQGVTLSAEGVLSGTPSSERTSSFTVTARDASGSSRSQSLTLRVTSAPAPFLSGVSFDPGAKKLTLAGLHLASGAQVRVNGTTVARPVKHKRKRGSLLVSGSADQLDLRTTSPNTVSVTVAGKSSNTITF